MGTAGCLIQLTKLNYKFYLVIDGDLIFTNENFIKLKNKVEIYFADKQEMSVSDFKELANTSRKYAVPLLEYFDKKKITYREGNSRKLLK